MGSKIGRDCHKCWTRVGFQRRQKCERNCKRRKVKKGPNEKHGDEEKFTIQSQFPMLPAFVGPNTIDHPATDGDDGSDDGNDEERVQMICSRGDVELKQRLRHGLEQNFDEADKKRE